jgi:hypothetical protein
MHGMGGREGHMPVTWLVPCWLYRSFPYDTWAALSPHPGVDRELIVRMCVDLSIGQHCCSDV